MFITRIWNVLEGNRHLMGWSVVFGLLFTGLGIIPPLLVGKMVRWLQHPELAGSFVGLALLVAAIYLFRGLARYMYGVMSHVAAYRTLHSLMNRVYRHLQSMSPSYLNRQHSGNLASRTIGDVEAIEDFIAHGIPESLLAIVIPLAMSCVLLLINWKLALVALLPLPFMAVLLYLITTRTHNFWRKVRRRFGNLSGRIQDHLSGITVMQSFVREADLAQQVNIESRDYRDSIIRANKWSLVPAGVIEAASGAGLVLIVLTGSSMISQNGNEPWMQVDVADLVVLLMYLGQIFLPFLRLANLNENLQKATASAERVFELLDIKPTITSPANAVAPTRPQFDIEFGNVDFSYEGGGHVLNDVSFQVNSGETVALVGETGVGKSTICHLMIRFYDVQSGHIRLGDVDIRELPLNYLRENVAFVSQDVFLFQGTIRDNLLLGQPTATKEELHAAAEAANIHEFIHTLPDGYETLVGERGIRLSGGQKQRVAIARALLKDAPVLILDEATSAVDAETESLISDALKRVTKGRTVLIVAHRVSTIMSADRIIVLDKGRVVQSGRYEELVAEEGVFSRLCRTREDVVL